MHTQYFLATLALALPAFASSAAYTKLGCYSEVPDLKGDSTNAYQAYGQCINKCSTDNYKIAVLSKGNHCSCSNAVPPSSAKVSDDKCNTVCPGYPMDYCGGDGTYMVLSTGESAAVSESDGGAAVTPTAATAAGGIVVAATNANPTATTVPTSILTAPGTMISKAGVSGAASSSATATAASSSASASPTNNAAVSLRGGSSIAGALVAGLGLLL
ncbi:WSC domain protein [Penicillium ochrochloron]